MLVHATELCAQSIHGNSVSYQNIDHRIILQHPMPLDINIQLITS